MKVIRLGFCLVEMNRTGMEAYFHHGIIIIKIIVTSHRFYFLKCRVYIAQLLLWLFFPPEIYVNLLLWKKKKHPKGFSGSVDLLNM